MKHIILLLLIFSSIMRVQAQDEDAEQSIFEKKGFKLGMLTGVYFANKYTASIYDGYGFDIDGNKNSFLSSFMYNKIIMEYGGGYGNTDQIALALNVNPNEWAFNESDMPINMRYNPAFNFGLLSRYSVDNNNAIVLNVIGCKLNVYGNFTITTTRPINQNQLAKNIHTFAIRGSEQRLMFQLGYNRIIGESDKLNFFVEGGLNVTMAKYDSNEILINNLFIDLTTFYDQPGFPTYRTKRPIGIGYGAFAGLGLHFNINPKCIIQLSYNPSYEGINIGVDPKLKLQHSIGLRFFYKLFNL